MIGMDGRGGEGRVGKMPRENEIRGLIPRGQLLILDHFFFADARYVSPTGGVRTLPKLDPLSARVDEGKGELNIFKKR